MLETDLISVKYVFSNEETIAIAKDQGRHMQEMQKKNEELDGVKSSYKSILMRLEADVSDCTRRLMSGYEMRDIRCIVLKFRPDNDSVMIVRTDNGRVVKRRKIDAMERQATITTDKPEVYAYECDLYEDTDSDIATMVAEDVPLYEAEAKELSDVLKIRPLAKKIGDGKKK